jgi:chromosome partitioning protein
LQGEQLNRVRSVEDLHKIVVLNPKGGCGKTTLATNLASLYAARGESPVLVDCDPQGYSLRWLDKRPGNVPKIYGVAAYGESARTAADVHSDLTADSTTVIIDLPAAVPHEQLHNYTYIADSILIPVSPSDIDVYSASRFIAELLLDAQLDRRDQKLAIVANRVREQTRSYRMLRRFLASLEIPLIAVIRDTQAFVHAAGHGIGVCEMPAYLTARDVEQLELIAAWLDKRVARLRERDEEIEAELAGASESALYYSALYEDSDSPA